MAFTPDIKLAIQSYVSGHLLDENWHVQFFSFVNSPDLAKRLGEEFLSTRFVYKMLEGLEADSWLLRAQIRMQVLAYASIYEAVLHHVLFERLPNDPEVLALTEFPTKKVISIPRESQTLLEKHLVHDGKKIIPTYESIGRTDETKVRFDRKADCAFTLGFIEASLRDDLIDLYEARNAIHIHAEIRKTLNYQIELSRKAYRRMEPFRDQVAAQLRWRGLITT
jgi:hypothetical protein